MAAKRIDSWVVSNEFWARVEPLVPKRVSVTRKTYVRKPGAGRPPKPARQVFEAVVYVLRTGCQWKALPKERFGSASAVHKRFWNGRRRDSSKRYGRPAWPSTTRWKESPGDGRALTEHF